MTETPTEAWLRKGFTLKDGMLVPIAGAAPTKIQDQRLTALSSKPKGSPLEARFVELWAECEGPELRREVHLIPGRMFRVDFLHEATKTVIEIQGLRDHASAKGFARDIDKFFMLQIDLGYLVVCFNRKMLMKENVMKLIAYITEKQIKNSGQK